MNVKLERIVNDIYFVSEWNEYAEPFKHTLKWKVEGPSFRVPQEQIGKQFNLRIIGDIHAASIHCFPHGDVYLWIPREKEAEIHERVEVPRPKVRSGIRTKWLGGWKKETKKEGWVPA